MKFFCKCLFNPFGLWCCSNPLFSYWFMSEWSIHHWDKILKSCTAIFCIRSVYICFIYLSVLMLYAYTLIFFFLFSAVPPYMEFPGQGSDPRHSCNLSQLWQCQILKPLCQTRNRTCIPELPRCWWSHCTTAGTNDNLCRKPYLIYKKISRSNVLDSRSIQVCRTQCQ